MNDFTKNLTALGVSQLAAHDSESRREREPTTPSEIRQRIYEIGLGRSLDDRRMPSVVEGIVRNTMRMADIEGLSGEDRYTFMAWHLLTAAKAMEERTLNDAFTRQSVVRICAHNNTRAINPQFNLRGAHLECITCGAQRTEKGWT